MVALVSAIGLEPSDAESLARQAAPLVVAKLPPAAARAAEHALAASGVLTMLTPHATLTDYAMPVRAKRLVAGGDGYLVELWRGPAALLDVSRIRLIVRAKLVRVRAAPPELGRVGWLSGPPADAESIIQGEELGQSIPDRPARVIMRDVIELHVRDGTRIRIDGSKFNFDVLGSGGALSDQANADRLAVRLAEHAAGAIVDMGFAAFRPPAWVGGALPIRRGLDNQRFPDDDPVFEFYSVWLSEVCQFLLRSAGGPGETGEA